MYEVLGFSMNEKNKAMQRGVYVRVTLCYFRTFVAGIRDDERGRMTPCMSHGYLI